MKTLNKATNESFRTNEIREKNGSNTIKIYGTMKMQKNLTKQAHGANEELHQSLKETKNRKPTGLQNIYTEM